MVPFFRSSIAVLTLLMTLSATVGARGVERPQRSNSTLIPTGGTMQIVPGVVVVKTRTIVAAAPLAGAIGVQSVDVIFARIGARSIEPFHVQSPLSKRALTAQETSVARILKVRYEGSDDPRLVAKELARDPFVEYAEPYYVFPMQHTPNDPMLSQQWQIAILKMQEAWDVTRGDSTIVIGDVDSGVDWTHEDLSLSIYINKAEYGTSGELSSNGRDDDGNGYVDDWHGWDFIGVGSAQAPAPDNNPMDGAIGHGTNTSGCMAATTNNGKGIAGTSYSAKILAIKAAGETTAGIAAGYEGIKYAADMGCKVINCSWGGTGGFSQALQDIIDYAYNKGALVVASSGNNPLDNDLVPHWPSSFNHVLNVGSIESNGSASTWCTYGTSVHVYAPGSSVLTTRKGGGYVAQTGTSFSSPLTAGIAALVFSVHPTWTPDQVAKQIRVTADPFTTPAQAKRYGRVNALKAVTLNKTLSDVPGVLLKSFIVSGPSGAMFTEGGQTARVEFLLENVLAPTSANAIATLELEDTTLRASATSFPLGVLPTFGVKTISVDLTLSTNPLISEGYIPVRLKITDGTYTDYVLGRVLIYLDKGWHATLGVNLPTFSSIDALNADVVWATVDVTQNQTPVQDYCFRSPNGGQSWFNAGGSGFPSGQGVYAVRAISDIAALVGTGPSSGNAAIYRTANSGQNWSNTSVAAITGFVNVIHMFDSQNGLFIGDPKSGKWGIGRTTDGGTTWTAVAGAPPAPASEAGWNNSYDFVGDIGWFGTNNGKVYKTTDRGATWTAQPTPSTHSVDVTFRDADIGAIRFSTQGSTGTNALAVTTNGGSSWTPVTTMQMTQFGSIMMERGGNKLWLLRDGNAYVTTNLGQTWTVEPRPSGFDPITVVDAHSTPIYTTVYAAGFNVYKLVAPFPKTSSSDKPGPVHDGFALDAVYPNPASGTSAAVRFTLTEATATELAVYDAAGRHVKTVFSAVLEAGAHSAGIGLTDLPAGMYHVRLSSGRTSSSRVLTVLK